MRTQSLLRPLLTLSAALLVPAAAQTTDPVKGSAAVKGEITFLTNKSDVVKGMIPTFEKLYPNVKVTLVAVGAADLLSKVTTQAAANQMPADVIQVEGYNVEFLVRRFPNLLQDITPWTAKYQTSFSKAQVQEGTVGGKRYGLPIDNSTVALYYRTDLFKKAGVSASAIRTWDDFVAAGAKVQAATPGVKMTQVNAFKDDELLRIMLQQTTGDSYFDANGDIVLNTPGAQKAFTQVKTLWDKGLVFDVPSIDVVIGGLKGSKIATFALPAFWGDLLQVIAPEQKGLWATMPLPGFSGPQPADFGTSFLTVAKASKNQLAAQAFAEWFATVGGQKRGQTPSTMNAYLQGVDKLNLKNPYFATPNYASPFLLGLSKLPYLRFTSDYPLAHQASVNAQAAILNGAPVAATLEKAAREIANQTGRSVAK